MSTKNKTSKASETKQISQQEKIEQLKAYEQLLKDIAEATDTLQPEMFEHDFKTTFPELHQEKENDIKKAIADKLHSIKPDIYESSSEWDNVSEFADFWKFKEQRELIGRFVETREFVNKDTGETFLSNKFELENGSFMWVSNNHAINKFLLSEKGAEARANKKLIKIVYKGEVKVKKGFVQNFDFFVKK